MKKPDRRQAKSDLFENETGSNFTLMPTFVGTTNLRHLRVIEALLDGPKTRKMLDKIAGCSNGPDLIFELRKLGLGKEGLPCIMVLSKDRDGLETRHGLYFLSDDGRRAVIAWLRESLSQSDTSGVHTARITDARRNSDPASRGGEGV
jgi:hypothetical protein